MIDMYVPIEDRDTTEQAMSDASNPEIIVETLESELTEETFEELSNNKGE